MRSGLWGVLGVGFGVGGTALTASLTSSICIVQHSVGRQHVVTSEGPGSSD
jgi:hypothetical protein